MAAKAGRISRADRDCRPGCWARLVWRYRRAQAGRVWACIEAEDGAVFRSDDYGESWIRLSEQSLLRTRPWYYMHVTADTQDADTVYIQNYDLWKSVDAGATFETMPTPHGDDTRSGLTRKTISAWRAATMAALAFL